MLRECVLFFGLKKTIEPAAVKKVAEALGDLGARVRVSLDLKDQFGSTPDFVRFLPEEELYLGAELIVVMGGDGSIIEAARRSSGLSIPIVGINFGSLGYLAELEFGEIHLFSKILNGDFKTESRMMLDCVITGRDGRNVRIRPCLNDVVLSNGPVSRLSSFDLFCDGVFITGYAADGIVISTPTGSSAYSMSAGGPLIYQSVECLLATPICPHSLGLRPIVFRGDSVLTVKDPHCRENRMFLTADGRENVEIFCDDTITVKKSDTVTRLVRVKEGGFLNVLHRKLSERPF